MFQKVKKPREKSSRHLDRPVQAPLEYEGPAPDLKDLPVIPNNNDLARDWINGVKKPKVRPSPLDKKPDEVIPSIGDAKKEVDKLEEILNENK